MSTPEQPPAPLPVLGQELPPIALQPLRHHWLNTIVGILDTAFYLTDEEQFFVIEIVQRLLTKLQIPERGNPVTLPLPVLLEITSSFYTVQLEGPRDSNLRRPIREASGRDIVVDIEPWRQALVGLLITAYPDLEPLERVVATKIVTDLLMGIGVPKRAAAYYPDDVVRAYNESQGTS